MKRPQTKFHAHIMKESQVIRSNKRQHLSLGQNLSFWLNISCSTIFSLYRYFIKTATTDSDMLLQA